MLSCYVVSNCSWHAICESAQQSVDSISWKWHTLLSSDGSVNLSRLLSNMEQVYRRRYESRCSSKPKLHYKTKNNNNKIWRKRFSIWRMEFVHPAMWHDHEIDVVRWLHHAMWHVALGTWQWIHQVAAPCNVNRGSGMTCHWIRPNVRHIGILHLGSISTISLQSTCHSAPVCEILSKLDHPRQKNDVMSIFKMADLSHLGF